MFTGLAYFAVTMFACVVMVMGLWKTYVKFGEPGWKCLIPYYNNYVLAKAATNDKRLQILSIVGPAAVTVGVIGCLGSIVGSIANVVGSGSVPSTSSVMGVLGVGDFLMAICVLGFALTILVDVMVSFKLARAFDQSPAMGIALIVCAPLAYLALGFDENVEYYGAED